MHPNNGLWRQIFYQTKYLKLCTIKQTQRISELKTHLKIYKLQLQNCSKRIGRNRMYTTYYLSYK